MSSFGYWGLTVFVTLLVSASCSVTAILNNLILDKLQDKTLVFVSGWPQSGTSLLQQIFTAAPHFSTMRERCAEVIATSKNPSKPEMKCTGWNHEGQWLLKALATTAEDNAVQLINPGSVCRTPPLPYPNLTASEVAARDFIITSWARLWDLNNPVLVEKSPQSMLKFDTLRSIFKGVKSIKFLIIIKVNVQCCSTLWLTDTWYMS
jgi:hypothetical protein